MDSKYLGALWMALAASIWGGMYVVSKIVLQFMAPLTLVWVRYVVALVFLVFLGIITRQNWRIRRHDWPLVAGIGVIGYGVSLWAQFRGTQLSTAQMGAVVTAATPAFMVVFGRLILGERISTRRAVSVGLATVGVLLVVGIGGLSASHQQGGLILLLAAVTWALMSVLVKRVPRDYDPLVVTTYAILVATILLTPAALPRVPGLAIIASRPILWGGILYLGIVSTAGAFYLWNRGLQLVDAGRGGLYFFLQPVVGTVLGWMILGERMNWAFGLGSALIFLGVGLTIRE